jgi:adenosylcobinamide-phosphate synthase
MSLATTLFALLAALLIEALAGYPEAVYHRIGHPVTWIGGLIGALDRCLNRETWSATARKLGGGVALAIVIAVPVAIAFVVQRGLEGNWIGDVILAVIASTLIASRSLYGHVRDVATALESGGLERGRSAVAKIVGRNPQALDEPGVARAAIESLAENASDGVVAPVIWFAVLGLPGIAAYKAINTADSMIGHRTVRHEAFGWAAARLDDLVNLPASRLTGLLIAFAAAILPGASPGAALWAVSRDAHSHRSPNAGWPEAAMAGALGFKLNGPKRYGETLTEDAYMGDGRAELNAGDIRRALLLAAMAWAVMVLVVAAAWFIARS